MLRAQAAGVTAAIVSVIVTIVLSLVISPPWGLGTILLGIAFATYASGYAIAAAS